MKPSRKVSTVLAVIIFLAFFTPWRSVSGNSVSILLASGVALAAEEESGANDPFAAKSGAISDPLERSNRIMFQFNDRLYFWVLKPASTVYSAYFPEGVRICIRSVFRNLQFPVRVVNNLFQGKGRAAGIELARFGINTTMGFGGLFDVAATNFHILPEEQDFGLTLGHAGVKNGIYIVWPIVGPSTSRDTVGLLVDAPLDPMFYLSVFGPVEASVGANAGRHLNDGSLRIGEYEDLKKSAVDPYISMRNAYIQYRADELKR